MLENSIKGFLTEIDKGFIVSSLINIPLSCSIDYLPIMVFNQS